MKILIIEDEIMAQANLARALTRDFNDMQIVGIASSVREAVAWLGDEANRADVIFMDVELSDGTCFEIFRQVDISSRVIMTTAYDNYAVKAFEVNSIDYLLKPIDPVALRRAVERCKVQGTGQGVGIGVESAGRGYRHRHIVRFNDRIVPVKTSDIAYFYAEEKNVYLVTGDDSRYIMDLSLDVLADELDGACFFRISRSCIIAMTAISNIVKTPGGRLKINAKPRPAFEMMVSRSRAGEFLKWLEEK